MAPDLQAIATEWDELQSAGAVLASALTVAADGIWQEGRVPAADLVEKIRNFRLRLADFRNRIDPECPAERAATEDSISYSSISKILSQEAERLQLRESLERVLLLRHAEDAGFSPLQTCHEEARQLLSAETTPESASAWQCLGNGKHSLQALLTQVDGGADLSDDAWAELGELLTTRYGRALATAAARGKLYFAQPTPEESHAEEKPAEGATAECSVVTKAEPIVVNEVPAAVVQIELVQVSPDLHAPEADTSPSFLDGDCPFNPLNPSSSLTQALASAPPAPAIESHPVVETPTPEIASEAFAEAESSPAAVVDLELAALESTIPQVATTDVENVVAEEITGAASPAEVPAEVDQAAVLDYALVEAPPSPLLDSEPQVEEVEVDATIFDLPSPTTDRELLSVEELAQFAAKADERQRFPLLCDLQVELLRVGRYSAAYQITRCLERRSTRVRNFLPLWLVRSLALGERLVFPEGTLALQLQRDFAEFRKDALLSGDQEWNDALGFFLRAAAIRPAVLAPVTRTANVLQAIGLNGSLRHLYNYCSRIIRFADQDQGDVLQQLRPNEYEVPRSREYQQLIREIEAWQSGPARMTFSTSKASPVESQELQQVVSNLLAPVLENQPHAAGWLRQEVQRLSSSLQRQSEKTAALSRPRFDAMTLSLTSEPMRLYLTEAIGFANRWLTLQGPLSVAIDAFVSTELQELRNSILERHEPALVELLACDQTCHSTLLSAGIAACRRAMQNVHDLFDPRVSPPCREPEIQHILQAELLKIPHLALNDRWEPELNAMALETELLELLSRPDSSWGDVWQMQTHWHNHAALERMLELDVWGNTNQRDTLKKQHESDVLRSRQALDQDVTDLRHLLDELNAAGAMSRQDFTAVTGHLDRLDKSIQHSTDFFVAEMQLSRIRSSLERKRAAQKTLSGSDDRHNDRDSRSATVLAGTAKPSQLDSRREALPPTSRDSVWVMDFN